MYDVAVSVDDKRKTCDDIQLVECVVCKPKLVKLLLFFV